MGNEKNKEFTTNENHSKKSGKQNKKNKKQNNKTENKNQNKTQKKQRKQKGFKSKKQGGGKMPKEKTVDTKNNQTSKATRKTEQNKKSNRYGKIKPPVKANPIKISFLGGLNEVGKNMTVYEYEKSMLIVDCGLAFPESDQLGVDFVIPDFSFVERNADKIKGILITHGHEDHIGALCYLLKKINVPVYATLLTAGLIMGKLSEHKLDKTVDVKVINPGEEIYLGDFNVEFIHVNHSIPGAVALAIKCDAGTIIQTGDFKIDTTPIDGEIINLSRFAELGNEGVLCLLSDSTNAEQPGYTQSESKVGETFQSLFSKAGNRRIIIATFASNIHRVQQIIDIASKTGRKVALSGRSLENVTAIASELGYVHIPEGTLIGIDEIKRYNDEQLVIITTGSQGEAMSALSRMASKNHRKVEIGYNDCVIISARPIPGNEKTVYKVINDLLCLGAQVVYEKMYDVHVSGHACQEELKIMLSLVKPKYFIPVHGEQKHLRYHAKLAESIGIPHNNIIIGDNGYEIAVSEANIAVSGTVTHGKVYVDGYGVGDVGTRVMRERQHLGTDGIIIIAATIDAASGELVTGPDIVSKGFVYVKEAELLMSEAVSLSMNVINSFPPYNFDLNQMTNKLRDEVSRLMYERTKRNPMILPIIMEVY
ncbi:MAG: ribonuclease J [Clostridia bacterium]|nr:ribonuclease J [Clostridia bacterium]